MKFQEIDFQIELLRAYCEPPGARMDYLLMLRKESNFKKETFLIKLEDAFNKIQKAWESEFYRQKSFILNPEPLDLSLPISMLGQNPDFWNFQGHINKKDLEELSFLITRLKIYFQIRQIKKELSVIPVIESKKSDESDSLKNTFNSMPITEVRSHFLPLIKKENPKKKVWMTNEDFEIFLRRSFGKDENLEKPKINLGHGAKYAIVKLFYQFYDKCQIEDYYQNRNKEPFLILLKDAFLTKEFDDLDTSNFKASNSKYDWN